jgi:hypothetical protein
MLWLRVAGKRQVAGHPQSGSSMIVALPRLAAPEVAGRRRPLTSPGRRPSCVCVSVASCRAGQMDHLDEADLTGLTFEAMPIGETCRAGSED